MTELLKVHGSQNSFFLLDQADLAAPLTNPEMQKLARTLTDRETGLLGGADGLLVTDANHPQMRVINADGSEASMCGNGLRTVARYLSEKTGKDQFKVKTMYANLEVRKADNLAENVPAFGVEISPVSFKKESLPFDNLDTDHLLNTELPQLVPGWRFTALSVPNPHLVVFIKEEELDSPKLGELGQYLNGDNPYFPDGVNVNYVVVKGDSQIFVKTFERGVGFTNACGTGMSASSLVFALLNPDLGHFEKEISVYNPGGMVKTILHKNDDGAYWIELVGNATFTHEIEIPEEQLHSAELDFDQIKTRDTYEQESYLNFVEGLKK